MNNKNHQNEDETSLDGITDNVEESDHRNNDRDAETDREPSGVLHLLSPSDLQIVMMFLNLIDKENPFFETVVITSKYSICYQWKYPFIR